MAGAETRRERQRGDGFWALHSCRNAAAGALLSPRQDELRSLRDGTVSGQEILLLALSGGACAGYAALALREDTSLRHFNADLIARQSHMLRVRITGAG
ncbi:hypothetical protein [Streptomyces sioyaensis]|uniref:hypothetical protein n=1 Tax=Streptomyces sioyaensis TaxID=67364 RepID=UPI003D74EFD1